MNWKNDKQRQIIFLILIISGTLILYSSDLFKNKKNEANGSLMNSNSSIVKANENSKDAEKFFSIFVKNPMGRAGIDALFSSIVLWDQAGNDSLIQSAIIIFERNIRDDSLKNRFYSRLGKYFVDMNRKSHLNTIGKILEKYSNSYKDKM